MKKVPASEATRKRLEEVFSGEQIDPSQIVREATRLMIEQVLEAEVEQAVGRRYYAHGGSAGDDGARPLRNGLRRGRIDSAEGVIEFNAPQVRGLSGWTSEVRSTLAGKSEELTRLAVEMYARGLSVRDIEATFTDEAGGACSPNQRRARCASACGTNTRPLRNEISASSTSSTCS